MEFHFRVRFEGTFHRRFATTSTSAIPIRDEGELLTRTGLRVKRRGSEDLMFLHRVGHFLSSVMTIFSEHNDGGGLFHVSVPKTSDVTSVTLLRLYHRPHKQPYARRVGGSRQSFDGHHRKGKFHRREGPKTKYHHGHPGASVAHPRHRRGK